MRDAYEASRAFLAEVRPAGPGLYGDPPRVTIRDEAEVRDIGRQHADGP